MKTLTTIVLLFLSVTLIGCGGGTVITGTVKYADGTPVTAGSVAFDSTQKTFFGRIQEDGSFAVKNDSGGGVPSGTYKVYLAGTEQQENKTDAAGEIISYRMIPTVAAKHTSPETSGLTFEVDGKTKTLDITVEKP